ncbi:MAG: zf-HC2 domain-containing protein [Thermoleophilaceae bacterium]
MISCSDAARQLWEYLDGAVEGAQLERLEEHLARCRRCCAELEFAEELRACLRQSADEQVPADVMDRLNATLEELTDR